MKDYTEKEKAVMLKFAKYMNVVIQRRIHTVVRDYLNGAKRNGGMPLDELDGEEYEKLIAIEDDDKMDTEDGVEINIRNFTVNISSDTLLKILDCLTPRERDTLLLSVGLGYEMEEVAKMLDLSNGRAYSYKSSALRKVREEGKKKHGKNGAGGL